MAGCYNGPDCAANNYDAKLARAYAGELRSAPRLANSDKAELRAWLEKYTVDKQGNLIFGLPVGLSIWFTKRFKGLQDIPGDP